MAAHMDRLAGVLAAAVVVGAGLMGAGPAPGPGAGEAKAAAAFAAEIARAMPTPRLFHMTLSNSVGRPGGGDMCMSGEFLQKMTALAVDARRAQPAAPPLMGCTLTHGKAADGSMRWERTCDPSAGARRASHTVLTGTVRDLRQRSETVIVDSRTGEPRVMVSEMRMVDAGDCPADLKPGQMRMADGTVVDALARAKVAKP